MSSFSHPPPQCPACHGPLIQKSRARLLAVGLLLTIAPGLAWFRPVLLIPGILAALTGIYLLVWATLGRGRWCRTCKTFCPGT